MNSQSDVAASSPLFSKTMIVLTGMMSMGAAGALAGAAITSGGLLLALTIGWLLLTVVAVVALFAAKADPRNLPLAAVATTAWTFMSGVVMGPNLAAYVADLGANTVFGAFIGTAGVMAVCGAFGMLSGLNFGKLQSILGFALLGFLIVGLFGLFFAFSSGFNLLYCIAGLVIFAGYFIVDFWRVKEMSQYENDWASAGLLAMMLYLDFVNFLMLVLRILSMFKKRD